MQKTRRINNSHSTIIGNTNSNQNIPKKRNNSGNRKRQDRKNKERNRIRDQQRKIDKKASKNL